MNKIWKNDNKQWKLQIRIERKILWNWNCNFILYQLFYISQPTNEHILNIYTKECLQLLRMKRIDLYSYYVYETIVLNLRYYMDNIINYWLITLCCMWQRQYVNPHRYSKVKTSAIIIRVCFKFYRMFCAYFVISIQISVTGVPCFLGKRYIT